jgi:2-hydroxy-3-keto-5-methylthiopentenyl-1-phosphate phosphatase
MKLKPIVHQDFDGIIFMQDSGHILFDKHGCGATKRQILDEQIKSGERSFRDVSEEMWASLNVPFDDGFEVMRPSSSKTPTSTTTTSTVSRMTYPSTSSRRGSSPFCGGSSIRFWAKTRYVTFLCPYIASNTPSRHNIPF